MDTPRTPDEIAEEPDNYCDMPEFSVTAQGHDFTFYPGGSDRRDALVRLIDDARLSMDVFYYLFDGDESGTMVRDALIRAARRGVAVRLLVDDFGNDAGKAFFDPLVEAGGQFAVFSPRLTRRYFIRNHQKMAIADGKRVMTGGANVSDHYFNPPISNGWCDLSVIIEGPVVEQFSLWFRILKNWVDSEASDRRTKLRALRDLVQKWDGGDGPVRLLVGGPLVRHGHWAYQFSKDLTRAKRLDTVSAYFSPPRSYRRQFAKVARRGQVRMMMAGKSDIATAIDMARMLYRKLLAAGAKIYEFQPCKLHMKMLIVDDASYVGSANLDKRSFRLNVELMVRIEDAALAEELRGLIDHMQKASVPITRDWYDRKATWFNRLRWQIGYWMSLADYRVSSLAR